MTQIIFFWDLKGFHGRLRAAKICEIKGNQRNGQAMRSQNLFNP